MHRPLAVFVLLAAVPLAQAQERRPNVVVILTDDQGWGDLSSSGNTNLATPNIDSLARQGARFERFYVQPVCSPTRAEFLTGRYHPRGGVFSTSAGGERLDLDESTIAETFQAAGYATAAFGKWHNGMQPPYHPNSRGFDEYYGFCSGHWGDYFDADMEHNGRLVKGEGYCVDDFTNRALRFIEEHSAEPFFVYLPYNVPHSPMQVPDRFWERFADKPLAMRHQEPQKEDVPHTRAALAMCENVDWNVGRLLETLDDLELAENTIVVYFCDNGPNGWRWNGGMKGRKGSTDEGGVRSPLYVRWPGRIPAGWVVKESAAAIDLRPTLAGLAGIPVNAAKPLDGRSLEPLLLDRPGEIRWEPRTLFIHWNGKVAARDGRWLLDADGKLFDLESDPGQQRNVAGEHADVAERLKNEAARYRKDVLAELDRTPRPFTIGDAEFPFTQLPARDAEFTGGIERSNGFPNCSYLVNWTSPEQSIRFDAEILTEGDYSVELHYTCPPDDVGSQLELTCGDARLTATITEPHESPLIGAVEDRVERRESYVKDFRPTTLGTIHLKPGRTPLVLRATKVPGKQVAEFRLLYLERRN